MNPRVSINEIRLARRRSNCSGEVLFIDGTPSKLPIKAIMSLQDAENIAMESRHKAKFITDVPLKRRVE